MALHHYMIDIDRLRGFEEFLRVDIMFLFVLFDGKLEKFIEPSSSADSPPVLLKEDAATGSI